MLKTLCAIIEQGAIKFLEKATIPEGTKVLITLLSDQAESQFWLKASQPSLDAIWNNTEDDVYAQLLKK